MMMMNDNCQNDGSVSLQRCKNHSNIKIEKVHAGGGGGGGGGINRYKLSLYSQNAWWTPPNEVKWIECKHLCKICESLPGHGKNGESVCYG